MSQSQSQSQQSQQPQSNSKSDSACSLFFASNPYQHQRSSQHSSSSSSHCDTTDSESSSYDSPSTSPSTSHLNSPCLIPISHSQSSIIVVPTLSLDTDTAIDPVALHHDKVVEQVDEEDEDTPSALQLSTYAASIIRNEAYALLALASRIDPVIHHQHHQQPDAEDIFSLSSSSSAASDSPPTSPRASTPISSSSRRSSTTSFSCSSSESFSPRSRSSSFAASTLSSSGQQQHFVVGPIDDPLLHVRPTLALSSAATPLILPLQQSRSNIAFRECVRILSTLPKHGKIIVTGVGKSGIVGRKMVATFCSLGTQAVFLHPLEALHGDLGVICSCSSTSPSSSTSSSSTNTSCDALLLISHSGSTAELMRLLPIVRSRVRATIAITRDPDSILARGCTSWLDAGTGRAIPSPSSSSSMNGNGNGNGNEGGEHLTDEADSVLPAPTSSVVTALAIGDAVALSLSRLRIGWGKGGKERRMDFLRNHPGGPLGIMLGREVRGVTSAATTSTAST